MASPLLALKNDYAALDPVASADLNALNNAADLGLALVDLVGGGVFLSTELNIADGGGLSVDISAGRAVVGSAGSRVVARLLSADAPYNLAGLTDATTNYIYAGPGSTPGSIAIAANTTGTPPAGMILIASCVTAGGAVSSVNNAPTGRVNLARLLTTAASLTAGSVLFAGADGRVAQDNAGLFYDAANHRLGIGTILPATALEVVGAFRTLAVHSSALGGLTGDSIEFGFFSDLGFGQLAAINRSGSVFKPLKLAGSTVSVNIAGTDKATFDASGSLALGAASANAAAQLQGDSTAKGWLPPRMTTTQKNAISSPPAGLIVYDTTLGKLCVYTTAWETITSA